MDRTERFYKIEMLIRNRGCVSFAELMKRVKIMCPAHRPVASKHFELASVVHTRLSEAAEQYV